MALTKIDGDLLVALWRAAEKRLGDLGSNAAPSRRRILEAARGLGASGFRDTEAYALLEKFAQQAAASGKMVRRSRRARQQPDTTAPPVGTLPPQESLTPAAMDSNAAATRRKPDAATRAHNKEFLATKLVNDPSDHPPRDDESSQPLAISESSRGLADAKFAAYRAADEAIRILRAAIEPVLVGEPWDRTVSGRRRGWVAKNRPIVIDMAIAGMSAEEIIAAHRRVSSDLGEPIRSMERLRKELNRDPDWQFANRRRVGSPANRFGTVDPDDEDIDKYVVRTLSPVQERLQKFRAV